MSRIVALTPLLAALAALLVACEQPADTAVRQASPPAESTQSTDCVRKPPAEPMMCTMDWRPVCGCDGVTYSNACSARAAGVSEFSDGECETARPE